LQTDVMTGEEGELGLMSFVEMDDAEADCRTENMTCRDDATTKKN